MLFWLNSFQLLQFLINYKYINSNDISSISQYSRYISYKKSYYLQLSSSNIQNNENSKKQNYSIFVLYADYVEL